MGIDHWAVYRIKEMNEMAENSLMRESENPDWAFLGRLTCFYYGEWAFMSGHKRFKKIWSRILEGNREENLYDFMTYIALQDNKWLTNYTKTI